MPGRRERLTSTAPAEMPRLDVRLPDGRTLAIEPCPAHRLGYDARVVLEDHPLVRIARALHVRHAREVGGMIALQLAGPYKHAAGLWDVAGNLLYSRAGVVDLALRSDEGTLVVLMSREDEATVDDEAAGLFAAHGAWILQTMRWPSCESIGAIGVRGSGAMLDVTLSPSGTLACVRWDCQGVHGGWSVIDIAGAPTLRGRIELDDGGAPGRPVFADDEQMVIACVTRHRWWLPAVGGATVAGWLVAQDLATGAVTRRELIATLPKGWGAELDPDDDPADLPMPTFDGGSTACVKLPNGQTVAVDVRGA